MSEAKRKAEITFDELGMIMWAASMLWDKMAYEEHEETKFCHDFMWDLKRAIDREQATEEELIDFEDRMDALMGIVQGMIDEKEIAKS